MWYFCAKKNIFTSEARLNEVWFLLSWSLSTVPSSCQSFSIPPSASKVQTRIWRPLLHIPLCCLPQIQSCPFLALEDHLINSLFSIPEDGSPMNSSLVDHHALLSSLAACELSLHQFILILYLLQPFSTLEAHGSLQALYEHLQAFSKTCF